MIQNWLGTKSCEFNLWLEQREQKLGELNYQGELTKTELSNGMTRRTKTIYPPPGELKGFGSKFQQISPEECWSLQRPKRREEYCNKDEDNIQNNANSVNSFNAPFQKQMYSDRNLLCLSELNPMKSWTRSKPFLFYLACKTLHASRLMLSICKDFLTSTSYQFGNILVQWLIMTT